MNSARCHSRHFVWARNRWATFEQLEPRRVLSFSFVDSGQSLGVSSLSTAVSLGDLDGDGDLDALVVNQRPSPSSIWINDQGEFTPREMRIREDFSTRSVALADFDGDGDLDALLPGSHNAIWINNGIDDLTVKLLHVRLVGHSVAVGDLDADGDVDAIVGRRAPPPFGSTAIWLNDGRGNFSERLLPSDNATDVALGDLDGSGWSLVVVNVAGNFEDRDSWRPSTVAGGTPGSGAVT